MEVFVRGKQFILEVDILINSVIWKSHNININNEEIHLEQHSASVREPPEVMNSFNYIFNNDPQQSWIRISSWKQCYATWVLRTQTNEGNK